MTGASTHPPDLLETIVAAARRTIEARAARRPLADLERDAARAAPDAERFRTALVRPGRMNVIAECKRRSPSRGVLCERYDAAEIARGYAAAGAAAISVLTEPAFFDGSLDDLRHVRRAVDLPLLRKDFVVDEYQLVEARAAGADAVLLIVAALEDRLLAGLIGRAAALGLAALVEVHDGGELARARDAGASIVGVNARNLRTLEVDREVAAKLVDRIPPDVVAVAESGIRSGADVRRCSALGYRAFLVGESLMTQPDPGAALAALLAGAAADRGATA